MGYQKSLEIVQHEREEVQLGEIFAVLRFNLYYSDMLMLVDAPPRPFGALKSTGFFLRALTQT